MMNPPNLASTKESFDLIMFEREGKISAAPISLSFSQKIFDEQAVDFQGQSYDGLKPFGEWLAICNDSSALVGVAILYVYQPDIIHAPFFQAENISKEGEDFHILFSPTSNPQIEGWPFLTVYSLKHGTDDYIIYIPDFYNSQQTAPLAENFIQEA